MAIHGAQCHENKNEIREDGGEEKACLHRLAEMSIIFFYYFIVLYCVVWC